MAACLFDGLPPGHLALRIHAVPRPPFVVDPRLHLVAAQPRYAPQLSGADGVHSAVLALGPHGIQPRYARDCSQG